jgi:hypothetical protein
MNKKTKTVKSYDTLTGIMEFESGEMDQDQIVEFFQHLIDTGTVWHLQGCYGRTAASLIESGYCHS